MNISQRIRGAIYGSAIGDGYGYPTEFKTFEEIKDFWPPDGPNQPFGNPILVTDDTQMALAVGNALISSYPSNWTPEALAEAFRQEFIVWLLDPKNNRAPGMTCLSVCEKLEKGQTWLEATSRTSKGCGANMRVLPVGLLTAKGISHQEIGAISQLQSAITHGHPTALAVSELTAICVALLVEGTEILELIPKLKSYAQAQMNIYHESYLKNVWENPARYSKEGFINRGWEEVLEVLDKVTIALNTYQPDTDPCLYTGDGWIAEESLATALLCFLKNPNSVEKTLKMAAVTRGDSDSIACLAGAFVGAYCGVDAIPQDWLNRIEYQDELEALATLFIKEE